MESTVNSENTYGISIFENIEEMSAALFNLLVDEFTLAIAEKRSYHLALSGGSTPVRIFQHLSRLPMKRMKWDFLHIYWSDERCVPGDHPESNYGNIRDAILRYIDIPEENIHRVHGEDNPDSECIRYSSLLNYSVPLLNQFPRFDLIFLGVGEDGHTASLFPDAMELLKSDDLCQVTVHPQTKQKRITFSLKVINNSKSVLFLVAGSSKAGIISQIIKKKKNWKKFPASFVKPEDGVLTWFIDSEAGKLLKKRFYFF